MNEATHQIKNNPLGKLNFAVLLQQQHFMLPVCFLFYVYNGLSLADFVLFQSIFYFTCLIAEIPAGYIGDLFPRKYVLIFSYMLFALRILLWLTMGGYWIILSGEILCGLSKSFYRGTADGYIYDYLNYHQIPDNMLKKYGKYNFFMSMGSAISGFLGVYFYKMAGFKFILSLELILHIAAITLLMLLPQIPHVQLKVRSFRAHLTIFIKTIKSTLSNKNISYHIYWAGILVGITSLFVWNFQPLMKSANVPVFVFGIIYFFNHLIRALGSLFSQKIIKAIPLRKWSYICYFGYIISFVIYIYNYKMLQSELCVLSLIVICIFIGIQMVYNVSTVAEVHKFASSKVRATGASVNNLFSSLCSGVFLMVFKELINIYPETSVFMIFAVFFVATIFIPLKINLTNR